MTSITQKQRGAPPMTAPTIPSKTALSSTTARAARTRAINWRHCFFIWIAVIPCIMLFITLWPYAASEQSRGIMGFLERDLHVSPLVVAIVLLVGVGITVRGLTPRWWLIPSVMGQGIYAAAALFYAIHMDVTLTQFAGHGGLFLLSLFGLIASVPIPPQTAILARPQRLLITLSKTLLIPIIGITLFFYAVGLVTRPDAGIAMFIQSQFGSVVTVGMVVWFAVGAGVVVQNHIPASVLFVALIPQGVYAVMAISFLGTDNRVSLAGVIVHLLFLITAGFVVLIQTTEYARILRAQQSRGA